MHQNCLKVVLTRVAIKSLLIKCVSEEEFNKGREQQVVKGFSGVLLVTTFAAMR